MQILLFENHIWFGGCFLKDILELVRDLKPEEFAHFLIFESANLFIMIEIIDYSDIYAADFKQLNLEWLDKYNLTESHDLMVLNDPTGTILDRG
ncbi:hypothetical protein AB9E30_35935, partial [Rhizobium leguminosarum]